MTLGQSDADQVYSAARSALCRLVSKSLLQYVLANESSLGDLNSIGEGLVALLDLRVLQLLVHWLLFSVLRLIIILILRILL